MLASYCNCGIVVSPLVLETIRNKDAQVLNAEIPCAGESKERRKRF